MGQFRDVLTSLFDNVGGIVGSPLRLVGLAIAAVVIFRFIKTSPQAKSADEDDK